MIIKARLWRTYSLVILLTSFSYSSELLADEPEGEIMLSQTGFCSQKPNCVSSLSEQEGRYIEPLKLEINRYRGTPDQLLDRLVELVGVLPRVKLSARSEDYLHFTFTTRIMKFKDDVYFWVNWREGQVEWKSQSRVGYSDLGANRKRLEQLRKMLNTRL